METDVARVAGRLAKPTRAAAAAARDRLHHRPRRADRCPWLPGARDMTLYCNGGRPAIEASIKGYAIVMRSTTAPLWEQEIYVGKVNTYTLKDVSVDDVRFGVKAVGADGTESLASSYVYPPRAKATYDATPIQ